GSGKSDLALRLIDGRGLLVADDQTEVKLEGSALIATCPAAIKGKIEARYVGVLTLPVAERTVCALVLAPGTPARLPEPETRDILGVPLPLLHLPYFEASTPAKIRLWLTHGPAA